MLNTLISLLKATLFQSLDCENNFVVLSLFNVFCICVCPRQVLHPFTFWFIKGIVQNSQRHFQPSSFLWSWFVKHAIFLYLFMSLNLKNDKQFCKHQQSMGSYLCQHIQRMQLHSQNNKLCHVDYEQHFSILQKLLAL